MRPPARSVRAGSTTEGAAGVISHRDVESVDVVDRMRHHRSRVPHRHTDFDIRRGRLSQRHMDIQHQPQPPSKFPERIWFLRGSAGARSQSSHCARSTAPSRRTATDALYGLAGRRESDRGGDQQHCGCDQHMGWLDSAGPAESDFIASCRNHDQSSRHRACRRGHRRRCRTGFACPDKHSHKSVRRDP